MNKPYSESCDQNKEPILSVISPILSSVSEVLEVGSGTGQHAVYFAGKLPHLTWHTSDCGPYLDGINTWLSEASVNNVKPPFELDVSANHWPMLDVDAIFTANSIHIMHDEDVVNFINGTAALLKSGGHLIIYGPFNYNGSYTSESNARFDDWLKGRDMHSGIKDFESIGSLAKKNALKLAADYQMPANNHILHFVKL